MDEEVVNRLQTACGELTALLEDVGIPAVEPDPDRAVAHLLRLDRVAGELVEALRLETCAVRATLGDP